MRRKTVLLLASCFILLSWLPTDASAKCLENGQAVAGTLEIVISQNPRGEPIEKFVMVSSRKLCLEISGRSSRRLKNVRRLGINPGNAEHVEISRLAGLRVALKGRFKPVQGKNPEQLDVIVSDAQVVGAYDPRNNKFHNWRQLRHRIAGILDRSRNQDSPARKEPEKDTAALTELIKKSLRETPEPLEPLRPRDDFERFRGTIEENIVHFVAEDFLRFHEMHPSDVVEYYAPVLSYNGDLNVSREWAVDHKFRDYRSWPNQRKQLLRNSIKIFKSDRFPEIYHVSFVYIEHRNNEERSLALKRSVDLMLDMDMEYIQIRKEEVRGTGSGNRYRPDA